MKIRRTLGNELVRTTVDNAIERVRKLPPGETVRDPWPNDRSLDVPPKQRKFRVTVVVTHTFEIDVEARHNRDAAHVAVDKLRTAQLRIGDQRQEISSMEIVTTKAVEID